MCSTAMAAKKILAVPQCAAGLSLLGVILGLKEARSPSNPRHSVDSLGVKTALQIDPQRLGFWRAGVCNGTIELENRLLWGRVGGVRKEIIYDLFGFHKGNSRPS